MKIKTINILIVSIVLGLCQLSFAQETGLSIMTKVDNRDEGTDRRSDSTMRLINKKGKERTRKVARLSKDYGEDTKSIVLFLEPRDIKGTGLLQFEYGDAAKDDDQWLYLPALKKVRRIASSKKSDNFMGTDFSYEDMGDREVDEDTHTLTGEENLNGYDCFVIESIPKGKSTYSKRVIWIIKESFVVLKTDFYGKNGKLSKQMNVSEIELIDGIWTAKRLEMVNMRSKHRTVIEIDNIAYNSDLKDSFFTERTLKKGRF